MTAPSLSFDQWLRIEHACTRLVIDYSHFADARQLDKWAQLFMEDAEVVVWGRSHKGRNAIRASAGDGMPHAETFHSVPNIRIDAISETEARGEVGVVAYVTPKVNGVAQAEALTPYVIGKYLDIYRLDGEVWRFARREFVTTMKRASA